MLIYGAGMSGLLAAQMLKRHNPVVIEAAPSLPNNHAALLRFRTNEVERVTGIKLKKVWVQKYVLADPKTCTITNSPNIQLQNMYSMKVTGEIKSRSIINLEPGGRYIAPDNFCAKLAEGVNIRYGSKLDKLSTEDVEIPIISTIPMPELMRIAGWSDVPKFGCKPITTVNAKIVGLPCEIYQTIYIPLLSTPVYRASITGDNLIVEMIGEHKIEPLESADFVLPYFFGHMGSSKLSLSNITAKIQKYGKLTPDHSKSRKEFILAMTDLYNLYSLGRFGTWRQILMDDVVKDIEVISNMIEERSGYSRKLKYNI